MHPRAFLGLKCAALVMSLAPMAGVRAEELARSVSFSEALRLALSQNQSVQLQAKQVEASEGAVLQNQGAFTPELVLRTARSLDMRPLNVTERATLAGEGLPNERRDSSRSTTSGIILQKAYLSGVQTGVSLEFASQDSLINAATGLPQQTTGTVRFTLRVPLLRNAGEEVVGAPLRASEYERDATAADLLQTASAAVLQTAQGYWDLLARQKRLDILRLSENRAADLVSELRKLIAADQIPAADINLATANEAEKRAARAAGEQAVQEGWANLARQLGMSAGEAKDAPLSGELPPINEKLIAATADGVDGMRRLALEQRSDLKAARVRQRAAQALVAAARRNLKPQFDLIAGVSSGGLAQGASVFALGPALGSNFTGPSVNVGLEYRWPYSNETARGLMLSRSASYDQSLIRVLSLEQSISTNIATLAASLRRIGARYQQAKAAAERYQITVANEQTKRRLGLATLIDVINVQDRLDNAQLSLLALQQEYASVLAQIDYETGRIVLKQGDEYRVDLAVLTGAQATRTSE